MKGETKVKFLRNTVAPRSESAYENSPLASWRSGYAADCKSVYTGSIPVLASI